MILFLRLSLLFSIVTMLLGFGIASYGYIQLYGKQEIKTSEQLGIDNPFFYVAPGTTVSSLLTQLHTRQGLSKDIRQSWYIKLHPEYTRIKFGSYEIKANTTVASFLDQVVKGDVVRLNTTLIPGAKFSSWKKNLAKVKYIRPAAIELTDLEIAEKLNLKLINGAKNLNNIEAYFLPDTYYYNVNSSDLNVLAQANKALLKVLDYAWSNRDQQFSAAKNPYQLLILASIIEKETNVASEYPIVSAVYNNRLNKGMRLQADPTLLYLKSNNNITKKDLTTDGPYNTYTRAGLPPTPINMPSEKAIYAAAKPANVNYIFMMAKGYEPGHVFSVTYKDHLKAQNEYLSYIKKRSSSK